MQRRFCLTPMFANQFLVNHRTQSETKLLEMIVPGEDCATSSKSRSHNDAVVGKYEKPDTVPTYHFNPMGIAHTIVRLIFTQRRRASPTSYEISMICTSRGLCNVIEIRESL